MTIFLACDADPAALSGLPPCRPCGPSDQAFGGHPMSFEITYADSSHIVLAVDQAGTVYALSLEDRDSQIYASIDGGHTYVHRGGHPQGATFVVMSVLPDGTLIADCLLQGSHSLARSTDHGATWTTVLTLGQYSMLGPHSIARLGDTVYFGEYQVFTGDTDLRLWASGDGGATWTVRSVFHNRRHVHSLVADESTGALWALLGDLDGGIVRSTDGGASFTQISGVVAVDAVLTPEGLLFGLDALYHPLVPGIRLLDHDGVVHELADAPGPSYSIRHLASGAYLLGETREPDGDVYAPGDVSAHLFGSTDGTAWGELSAWPRAMSLGYARADVHWELPSGEAVVELRNIAQFGPANAGYLLVRAH